MNPVFLAAANHIPNPPEGARHVAASFAASGVDNLSRATGKGSRTLNNFPELFVLGVDGTRTILRSANEI